MRKLIQEQDPDWDSLPDPIPIHEVAAVLGVTTPTIRSLRRYGALDLNPVQVQGKKLHHFTKAQVKAAWEARQEQSAVFRNLNLELFAAEQKLNRAIEAKNAYLLQGEKIEKDLADASAEYEVIARKARIEHAANYKRMAARMGEQG